MSKKILYISPKPVHNTNERASGILRFLSKRYIVFSLVTDLNERSTVRRLAKTLINLPKFFLYGIKYIYIDKADVIFCELIESGFIGTILSIFTGRPCIWDVHRNTLSLSKQLGKPKIYEIMYLNIEKILWNFVSKVLVVSESEKLAYKKQGIDVSKIEVIPISVDFNLIQKVNIDKTLLRNRLALNLNKKMLLFFGDLDQPPNKNAVQWINRDLAPAIFEQFRENVEILIAGNGEVCKEEHHAIVNYLGFKKNIYEYINLSDIIIVPIWMGEGQQTKLIDSMMCAKLTIVNKISSIGIPELLDGYNTIIAQDQNEFIQKTLIALNNINNLNQIEINAKKMVETHYNWDRWKDNLFEIIEKSTNRDQDTYSKAPMS